MLDLTRFQVIGLVFSLGTFTLLADAQPTIIKARCYANCLEEMMRSTPPDPGCSTATCQQCLKPCESTFVNTSVCNMNCGNTAICLKSCQFLNTMLNWKDLENGQGSTIPRPGTPVVDATRTTTGLLALSWQPSAIANTAVVYMLRQRHAGDKTGGPFYLPKLVLKQPKADLTLKQTCTFIRNDIFRSRFNGLTFQFQVVAVTRDSKLAFGDESPQIAIPKPPPVMAVVNTTFFYVDRKFGGRLDLAVALKPPTAAGSSSVTNYVVSMPAQRCNFFLLPTSSVSKKGSPDVRLNFFTELKACNLTMRAQSLAECIPSDPLNFTVDYKGCRFLKSFPRNECLSFDPPPTDDSERAVRNLARTPLQPAQDYRFFTNITWLEPTFPYSFVPFTYNIQYSYPIQVCFGGRCITVQRTAFGRTKNTSVVLRNLVPNTNYTVKVSPSGKSDAWRGVVRTLVFKTPAVPASQLLPLNIQVAFSADYSPSTKLSAKITWAKPAFNYGTITSYTVTYKKGNGPEKTVIVGQVGQRMVNLQGFEYNEPLIVKVKATYKEIWISEVARTSQPVSFRAPAPDPGDIIVNNLRVGRFVEEDNDLFAVNFTWEKPTLKNVPVDHYKISYRLTGYPGRTIIKHDTTRNTVYLVSGIYPVETVTFLVTPVFRSSSFFTARQANLTTRAPKPKPELLRVRNLSTCSTNNGAIRRISWDSPLAKFIAVKYYKVRYMLKWLYNPRFVASGAQIENYVAVNYFNIPEIDLSQKLLVEVTPVFIFPILSAESARVTFNHFMDMYCKGRHRGYYEDPYDCSSFCRCSFGHTFILHCPRGHYWNDKKKACDWARNVHCPYFTYHRHGFGLRPWYKRTVK